MLLLEAVCGTFRPSRPVDHFVASSCRAGDPRMAVDLSMSVLVVDDYSTMIRIIRNLLKQLGFEHIDDASDGSAALTKGRRKKMGVALSEWNMGPMAGQALLSRVPGDPNFSPTPFIMITAESKTEN